MADSILVRAQEGDSDAFAELIEPYRRELLAHCYRILGSFQDAEDILQEALVSAWQALGRFDGRSLKAWLYRIATNRCLNYLRDASRRPRAADPGEIGSPFASATPSDEPWWLEPYPEALVDVSTPGPEARYDARESIALSFVAGLQHLPTQQRVALVLRDVLGFSTTETAEMLETSPASVNSALQRARSGFKPSTDLERVLLPRSERESDVVDRFVDAFERGDLDSVIALLTQDAKLAMPPEPFGFRGPEAIAGFYRSQGFSGLSVRLVPTRANGQPAFGYYLPDPKANIRRGGGILVLALSGGQISEITRFGDRGLLARFGLPRTLPSAP